MADEHNLGPINVLFVGSSSEAIVEPLGQAIKRAQPKTRLGIVGPKKVSGENEGTAFDDFYPEFRKKSRLSKPSGGKSTASVEANSGLPRFWLACLLLKTLLSWITIRSFFRKRQNDTDILHLQGMFIEPVHLYAALMRPMPMVVTLWGSDYLRDATILMTALQKRLLERADHITVSPAELKETVLAKYGRGLERKLSIAYMDPAIDDVVSCDVDEARSRCRDRYEVGDDQLLLCLGHNGFPENQHSLIIDSLRSLSNEHKKKIFVVVPMTYGGTLAYQERIASKLHDAGLEGTLIRDYLPNDEMVDFRLGTDIMLYGPISDAFSGTVSQALACETVVILGSWLPYKARVRAGFRYWEVDAPQDFGIELERVLFSWAASRERCKSNRELSTQFFDPEKLGHSWHEVYRRTLRGIK